MADLKSIVQNMIDDGVPEKDIGAYISTVTKAKASEPLSIFTPANHGTMDAESIKLTREAPERVKREMMDVPETYGEAAAQTEGLIRPILEGGGQLGGELGGAYLGALTSPITGPIGPFAGATAGGGGGYAAGSWLSDLIYSTDKADLANDLMIGGATSGLGQAAGPVAKWAIGKLPNQTVRAGKRLYDAAGGEIKNFLGKADELISQIPGFEPMLGQSGEESANITGLARKVLNSGDENLNALYNTRLKEQNEAMKSYLRGKIPAGDVDDLVNAANEVRSNIAREIEIPQEQLIKLADSISSVDTPDAYSGEIRELLREAQDNMHKIASKKWDDLPNYKVGANSVKYAVDDLRKELTESAMVEDLPAELMKAIDNTPLSESVPLSRIRKWISTASKKAYSAPRGSTEQLAAKKLQRKLEETLDKQLGGMSDYNAARKLWGEYKDKFFSGPVGKALDPKKGLSDLVSIRGMYNPADPQKADAIIKALGPEQGKEAISNIALSELRDKAYLDGTGVLDPKKASIWVKNNRNLLKRYGLEDDFIDFEKVGQRILDAEKNNTDFQKTILSKIKKKNPDEIISSLLSSSESGYDTIRLMSELSGNPTAIEGLRAAFKEHALKNAMNKEGLLEGGALRDVLKKYEPVMKVLYSNPDDLKALYDMRKLLSFTEELYPKGAIDNPSVITKLAYGRETPIGGSAVGWADIVRNWYKNIGEKRLEEALFDPKLAKRLMERFSSIKNISGNIAGAGATYSTPTGELMNSFNQ